MNKENTCGRNLENIHKYHYLKFLFEMPLSKAEQKIKCNTKIQQLQTQLAILVDYYYYPVFLSDNMHSIGEASCSE